MSTRGVIARRTGDTTFAGVYHHWDSYPAGLGQTLWNAYHTIFDRNLETMLKLLLSHSWSTIVDKDLTLAPGWGLDIPDSPACYCCGERAESVTRYTESNAASSGCEFCYAFSSEDGVDRMSILASYNTDHTKMIGLFGAGNPDAVWCLPSQLWDIDLNQEEPNWTFFD